MLRLTALFGLVAVHVAALPAPQDAAAVTGQPATATAANACAQISPATASMLAMSPQATPTVAAALAQQCLQSVPNKRQPAQKLITSLKAYAGWQTTLAWLKAPPPSYMLPAVDIMAGLDNISATAGSGGFASEYDFQMAIVDLFSAAHDGHFAYRPDVFKAFVFRNPVVEDLVSLSVDGMQMPKLYHSTELKGNSTGAAASGNASLPRSISKINGQDAAKFIEALNLRASIYQDLDSQWNSQFATYATPDSLPILAASLFFQGPSLTLTYDNGDERTEDSIAAVRPTVDFAGVRSGEDFYNKFCNPELASRTGAGGGATATPPAPAATTPAAAPSPAPTISGFPFPAVRDNGANITSGYFLNGTGYDDTAVLSVIGFAPEGEVDAGDYLTNFQDTISSFLAKSKQANKQKLVIDVTGNGGGIVVAGYELFAQLFPGVTPFQADNMRLTDSLQDIARIVNGLPANIAQTTDREQQTALLALQQSAVVSNLVPGGVFAPDGQMFDNVDDILAPVSLMGDRFTAYQSTPLNQTSSTFNLTGTGTRANPPPAVFKPENIVLLTDGTCGSTCTLFAYLLIMQLNVATIVVGGRPTTGPMQAVGGVEGAQVFPMSDIGTAAAAAMALSPPDRQEEMEGSELAILAEGYALSRASSPTSGSVNGKNAFSSHDSKTPLEFLYQAANCRFFYTPDMVGAPAEVWKRAADATWKDPARLCVKDSRMPNNNAPAQIDPIFRQTASAGTETFGSVGLSVVFVATAAAALLPFVM